MKLKGKKREGKWKKEDWIEKKKKIIHYLSNFIPDIYFSFFLIILWFFVFCIIFQQSSFYKKKLSNFVWKIFICKFFISKEGKNWIRTLERVWKSSVLSRVLSHANGKRIHHEENALLAEQKKFKEKGETKHGVHCIQINRIISTLFKGWRSMDH